MLNLRQIEIFRAVMTHQTTVGAARELHISQPAISNSIRHLEDLLGFPLFDRTGNRLIARDEAKRLYQESEALFLLSRALNRTVEDLKADQRGHVRISATPQLGHTVLPTVLHRFLSDRPRVKVFLDIVQSYTVMEHVEASAADFGLAVGLEKELEHTFKMIPLGDISMVCLVPRNHPLAERSSVRPSDLTTHTFIGLDINSRLGPYVRSAFRNDATPYSADIEVRFSETAARLVKAGVGITVVDGYTAQSMADGSAHTRIVPFEPNTSLSAWAIHLRSRPLSRISSRVIDVIRDCMQVGQMDIKSNSSKVT
jgi:DNA-binding transcriptional LysR family regulator